MKLHYSGFFIVANIHFIKFNNFLHVGLAQFLLDLFLGMLCMSLCFCYEWEFQLHLKS